MSAKRKLYILLGILCLVLCLIFVLLALPRRDEPVIPGGPSESAQNGTVSTASSMASSGVGTSSNTTQSEIGIVSEEPEPYVSPVDFETLWERCGDIYAWLEVPDTDINYPVVQSATDDAFYIDHSIDGEPDRNGSIYTEHTYNNTTFSDPVTLIYGHNMRSGAMFGYLQEFFSDPEWFEAHETFIVYQPDRELHYRVFAAVPYGTKHILYKYRCFREPSAMTEFLDVIYNTRKFGTNYRQDCTVTEDDHIVILCTCLPRSADGRYLVLARLEEVIGAPLEPID